MGTQRYSILYSSKTGNTKKLVEKIREVLPEKTVIILEQKERRLSLQTYYTLILDRYRECRFCNT